MKYNDLKKKLRLPLFSKQDLQLHDCRVFAYQLSLWKKQGSLVKLKNGLYAWPEQLPTLLPEETARFLYAPSYISLEKALAHYGLIPEMVYAVTCITPKVTRRLNNKMGKFIFRHLKPALFFGYQELKGTHYPYLLAYAEKALLDFIYLNLPRLKNQEDIRALRLNAHALRDEIDLRRLSKYLKVFQSKKMAQICQIIFKRKL
jgi:predicted transcriptional regulator of viral defense system